MARQLVASFKLQRLNGVATTGGRTMAGCQMAKQLKWQTKCWAINCYGQKCIVGLYLLLQNIIWALLPTKIDVPMQKNLILNFRTVLV